MAKVSEKDKAFIVKSYSENTMTMIELSELFDITRQGIWKVLKGAGIDTSKRKLEVVCYWCEKMFKRAKKRMRWSVRAFCCLNCYTAYLNDLGADYIPNRHGMRVARSIVGMHFKLSEGNVVHHENKNCRDNMLGNLKVFRTQGDHTRYHRIGKEYAKPIWEGKPNVSHETHAPEVVA